MGPLETVIIIGAERFSNYKGYSREFTFHSPYDDQRNRINHHLSSVVVAIDALYYEKDDQCQQLSGEFIDREITKAYSGFCFPKSTSSYVSECSRVPIVTGLWGCGN